MKQEYKSMNMRGDTLALIARINTIIDDYVDQGFTLSVHQLYYQLVAKAVIENTERSYKRIASVISDARLCGFSDGAPIATPIGEAKTVLVCETCALSDTCVALLAEKGV
jgi:hypothetical protein